MSDAYMLTPSATKPKGKVGRPRKLIPAPPPPVDFTQVDRHPYRAVAAYHKSEARGCGPSDTVHDWLQAERELACASVGGHSSA